MAGFGHTGGQVEGRKDAFLVPKLQLMLFPVELHRELQASILKFADQRILKDQDPAVGDVEGLVFHLMDYFFHLVFTS